MSDPDPDRTPAVNLRLGASGSVPARVPTGGPAWDAMMDFEARIGSLDCAQQARLIAEAIADLAYGRRTS